MKRKLDSLLLRVLCVLVIGLSGSAHATECTQYDESCTGTPPPDRIETIIVEADRYIEGGNNPGFDIWNLIYYEYPDYNTGEVSHTGWNDPASGRCGNEIETFDKLGVALANWTSTASQGLPPSGPPPGRLIMSGPFTDLAFQGTGWGKYDYQEIFNIYSSGTGTTTRYSVHIHYMANTSTGAVSQIRLNSSYAAGCEGTPTTKT